MKHYSRRDFTKTSLLSAGIMIPHLVAASNKKRTPPNLLLVFPDQMRGQALGFLKKDPVVTPCLDAFARESLVLPQAVSNYPVCSPFRAMLMSGMYPLSNRVVGNCNSARASGHCELQKETVCWSDVLKQKGYSLGYIGKWHLDSPHAPYIQCGNNRGSVKWNEWCSPDRRHGFDFWHAYGTYDMHMNPMYWDTHAAREEFHYVKQWGPEHEADCAINYIHNKEGQYRDNAKPFALVVSMNPPHTPYDQFPKKYLEPYADRTDAELIVRDNVDLRGTSNMSKLALSQTRNYFANITGVDDQFGRILKALDDTGLKNDTIVLFTSDHGNCVGTHNQATKNNLFEESMLVPFLIRWPGKIKPRQDDLLISSPDIYPTVLELMGLGSSIPAAVQGTSWAQLFATGKGERPTSQMYIKIPFEHQGFGHRGVRTATHKLVMEAMPDKPMKTTLYHLETDPCELKNVASEQPEVVEQLLQTELIPWLKKMNDPWIENV